MKLWRAVIVAVLVCVSCSSHAHAPRPDLPDITRADDHKAVTVHVGQVVDVYLYGPYGAGWNHPQLAPSGIVEQVSPVKAAPHQPHIDSIAMGLRATHAGRAKLTAIWGYCNSRGQSCDAPVNFYTVTLIVEP